MLDTRNIDGLSLKRDHVVSVDECEWCHDDCGDDENGEIEGNQPTHNAGIQGNFDAGKVVKEVVSAQQYVLLSLWSTGSKDPHNTDADAAFDVKDNANEVHVSPSKFSVNSTNRVNAASSPVTAVGPNPTNSTNNFNAASSFDNAVSPNFEIGGKSSFVDPSQYPGDPDMPALEDIVYSDDKEDVAPQTRSMARMVKEQGGLNQINDEDFHTCMFACFLSQEEPKRVHQALKYPSWIKAVQEELLQFKMKKVWVLVDLPKGKRAIGSKWVFRNKKDKRGIIIRNKAQLVAQRHTQEEGIDYEEVFAPVYVDDIIFGFTNKELCKAFERLMKDKFQISSMGELTFFIGLQVKKKDDGIFISQDKYVAEILRKFGLTDGKSASTPIDTEKPLLKDPDVKKIFRYLKGKPHLGLWYPKDSPFNLVAYSDSNYARASLDKKSTTGGCQFLGYRLISWQCKKHTVVATSSTEAQYVAAASCYAQVLCI
nr:copia protein [Tanacetum cinerariifolium]